MNYQNLRLKNCRWFSIRASMLEWTERARNCEKRRYAALGKRRFIDSTLRLVISAISNTRGIIVAMVIDFVIEAPEPTILQIYFSFSSHWRNLHYHSRVTIIVDIFVFSASFFEKSTLELKSWRILNMFNDN